MNNSIWGSSSVELKVTPDTLVTKSTEVSQKVEEMKRHFETLKTVVDKTKGYWLGEAGDMHRQMYHDLQDDIDEILKRLGEHPVDLLAIAQKYTDVELSIQREIMELPGDIIL